MLRLSQLPLSKKQAISFLSGGIDSAVATAIMKKQQNYSIQPVYVKNWNFNDETGESGCEKITKYDISVVEKICKNLEISKKLIILDCSREYWQDVFEPVLESFESGGSLNADVLCNEFVKFDAWVKAVDEKLGLTNVYLNETTKPKIITGHYAKKCPKTNLLTQATDKNKCQVLFLSRMPRNILKRTIFPLGNYNKNFVKNLAVNQFNLKFLIDKPESMGICFIGKRKNFGDFLGNYVDGRGGSDLASGKSKEPKVIDLKSGQILGEHKGLFNFTLGQKPKNKFLNFYKNNTRCLLYVNGNIKGSNCVVADLDYQNNNLYLTNSNESLESSYSNSYGFANMIRLVDFQVYDEKPFCSSGQIGYDLTCQYMNRQVPIPCKIIFKNDRTTKKRPF